MKKLILWIASLSALCAQDIAGIWQGTMTPPNQDGMRIVLKIAANGNAYQGNFYNLDNGRQFVLGTITVQGSAVKIVVPGNGLNYDGKFETDGNSITGAMISGTTPMPLPLKRATAETAWELPPPPAAPKLLAEVTKLEFEVATIKPTPEGQVGTGITVSGREFRTRSTALVNLLTFAFALHPKQLSGLPAWASTDRYDIQASIPGEGAPNDIQLRTMLQKLIQDRFGLVFHTEKRELSIYAIRTGKGGLGGVKLAKNESRGTLPGIRSAGLGRLGVRNATMADLAFFLQARVLDRPAIDESGLTDRYDFTLDWTPDEFQYPDAGQAQRSAIPTGPDAPPDLLTAFQEQLGLRLEATKALADVMAVDKVSRPSEN